MTKTLTQEERDNWRDRHFIKKAVPYRVRMAIAARHGCFPGEILPVKCHYCDFVGEVWWHVRPSGEITNWVSFPDLEMDHVIPEFHGGESTEENIVLACRKCNRSKGTRKAPRAA